MKSLTKKTIKACIISTLITLITAPIIFYILEFNPKLRPSWFYKIPELFGTRVLSNKNSDWGDFGSFLSGLYGSIFSFLSLIAVLYSLRETQKSSAEQVKLLKSEQFTNEFILLLNTLTTLLSSKIYPNIFKENMGTPEEFRRYIYNYCASMVGNKKMITRGNYRIFAISEVGVYLNKNHEKIFEKELAIYSAMIFRINQSEEIQAKAYRAILIANIDTDTRFMLTSLMATKNVKELFQLSKRLNIFEIPSLYEKSLKGALKDVFKDAPFLSH
ncbi:hypothetical protein [Pectobacterium brasiliense]|uniref:hypothetical protein n=1 Tax=Pectobacterium brasiliense TaxID=180957 RepID=UPI003D9BA618